LPEEIVMKLHLHSLFSPRGLGATLSVMSLLLVAPGAARAHIKMSAPADWITTNSSGDPQKITPCGVDPTKPSTFTVTNAVTTLHVGDKVTFNWTETVPHDGHFRIALAITSRDELTDPAVTKMNSDGTAAEAAAAATAAAADRPAAPAVAALENPVALAARPAVPVAAVASLVELAARSPAPAARRMEPAARRAAPAVRSPAPAARSPAPAAQRAVPAVRSQPAATPARWATVATAPLGLGAPAPAVAPRGTLRAAAALASWAPRTQT
jgi:hypothetical protein